MKTTVLFTSLVDLFLSSPFNNTHNNSTQTEENRKLKTTPTDANIESIIETFITKKKSRK